MQYEVATDSSKSARLVYSAHLEVMMNFVYRPEPLTRPRLIAPLAIASGRQDLPSCWALQWGREGAGNHAWVSLG
eukprot:scaffold111638_cov33-Tisochrysis_lutea.AAC.7